MVKRVLRRPVLYPADLLLQQGNQDCRRLAVPTGSGFKAGVGISLLTRNTLRVAGAGRGCTGRTCGANKDKDGQNHS